MNPDRVISQLKEKYPGKEIVENRDSTGKTTEIICEIVSKPDFSWAIAVIDHSPTHYHTERIEIYKVIKGSLTTNLDGINHNLKTGDFLTIPAGVIHYNQGNETWIDVVCVPGWNITDHHLVD